jgi:[protein-PII] uridylyltransferase
MEPATEPELRNPDRTDQTARVVRLRRQHLRRALQQALAGSLSEEELDVHFTQMPDRYWARVNQETVHRHLLLTRQFLRRLHGPQSDGTTPVVAWRQLPDRDLTEVEVCTWDRLGLLAKVAGAFAAADLSVTRADVFTRADNVVLDMFQVCEADGHRVRDEAKLHLMEALLTAALRPEATEDTLTEWETRRPRRRAARRKPDVFFDADRDDLYTVLFFEADDRVGLLHDVFTALASCRVNVTHAIITTEKGRAGDVVYLTDADGQKIVSPARIQHIREHVWQALH